MDTLHFGKKRVTVNPGGYYDLIFEDPYAWCHAWQGSMLERSARSVLDWLARIRRFGPIQYRWFG